MGKLFESARKKAEKISKGVLENQHLGSHSSETIDQELYALEITKPMFRDGKWHKKARSIRAEILNEIAKGKTMYQIKLIRLNQIEERR